MQRRLCTSCLVVLALAACRKTPVVDEMRGIHDTGSGWFPDDYDALRIPWTGAMARRWASDPTKNATWAREADCEVAKICDADGFAYRATNPDGTKLFVTYNGELSVRRAEATKNGQVRAFELVYVPTLPYLLHEVERARVDADGGVASWQRPSPRVYDAYPLYRRAIRAERDASEKGRLLDSYVTAFGVSDERLVREAYRDATAAEARAGLLSSLCYGMRTTPDSRNYAPFYRDHVHPDRIKAFQRFIAELVMDEQVPEVLFGAFVCFVRTGAQDPVLAAGVARRLVRSACTAQNDVEYDAARAALHAYPHHPYAPFETQLRQQFRDAAEACADTPYKRRLLGHYNGTDAEPPNLEP